MEQFLPKMKTRFLSEELSEDMYYLIERLDDLRDILQDARYAENHEEFDSLMESAWEGAQSLSSDIDDLRYEGNELHSERENHD